MSQSLILPTEIKLRGDVYKLVFNLKAFITAERLLDGRSLLVGGLTQDEVSNPRVELVSALFYAAALANHPELTFDTVVDRLVTPKNFPKVWEAVIGAWMEARSNDASEDDEENPPMGVS